MKELRTAIMIKIFFYYRPPLLLLAGCMQLCYSMVLGISKDAQPWTTWLPPKRDRLHISPISVHGEFESFLLSRFLQAARGQCWVFFCLFFLLFLTDFRMNEFSTVACCLVSFPKSQLKMAFC